MEISISTSRSVKPWHHKKFTTIPTDVFCEIITKHVWSPIIWRDGKRLTENFLYSDCAVFDFDDGRLTVGAAIKLYQRFAVIIAPTKSHRLAKDGQPPRDRFRLVVPWSRRITSYPEYRQNLERLYKGLPCDQQCKDGARMYQPSIKIEYMNVNGKNIDVLPFKPDPVRKQASDYYVKNGVFPKFLEAMIREVPEPGNRNTHCFRIAAKMGEMGFSESDAVNVVLDCAVDLPPKEKEITARSGHKAGSRRKTYL